MLTSDQKGSMQPDEEFHTSLQDTLKKLSYTLIRSHSDSLIFPYSVTSSKDYLYTKNISFDPLRMHPPTPKFWVWPEQDFSRWYIKYSQTLSGRNSILSLVKRNIKK